MKSYALYLESGPKHKKTMVHVPELLGCIAQGPTTETALENTPAAIRLYLGFLARRGEAVDPDEEFTTHVAQHVTEGDWLGNGSSAARFDFDFEPLATAEVEKYIRWLGWTRGELLRLAGDLSDEQLDAVPERGRPIRAILEHIFGAEPAYVRTALGNFKELSEATSSRARQALGELECARWTREVEVARIRAATAEELNRVSEHGATLYSPRKMLRRMLEHEWEHVVEIADRLGVARPS